VGSQAEIKIRFSCLKLDKLSILLMESGKKDIIWKNGDKNPHKSRDNRVERFMTKKVMAIEVKEV
jgi:hypothetical protein